MQGEVCVSEWSVRRDRKGKGFQTLSLQSSDPVSGRRIKEELSYYRCVLSQRCSGKGVGHFQMGRWCMVGFKLRQAQSQGLLPF